MKTGIFVDHSIYLPPSTKDWILLLFLLAIIVLLLNNVADRSTAMLGVAIGLVTYSVDKHFYLPITIALVALVALVAGVKAHFPNPGLRALREGAMIGAGFLIYENGRAAFVGSEDTALSNAAYVSNLEQRLHLLFEPALQRPFLEHESLLRAVNGIYSWAYLPFVLGALFWLYLTNDSTFKLMRNALGISVPLALTTIALFPVAPPRLASANGLVDTHLLLGKLHGFVNPFAAIPSFHVGWTALGGYMLFRSVRGKIRWFWAIVPVSIMAVTVIVTGNHYWIDGVVGCAFALIPAAALSHSLPQNSLRVRRGMQAIRSSTWADRSILALGVLWLYLIVRQIVDPGFTHYWGYMVVQITATIIILIGLEIHFSAEGGLSWLTYIVATVSTWADTLGTAGSMYDRYSGYDKIVHFGGGVAITAVAADLLFAFRRKRGLAKEIRQTFVIAALISLTLNVGWEIYEYLGDRVFSTGRHAGWIDTTYDLICDSAGILVALVLLASIEPRRFDLDNQPLSIRASTHHFVPGLTNASSSRSAFNANPSVHPQSAHRFLLIGFLLPIVVVAVIWIDAAFTPGYSHISDTVSDLAEQGRSHAFVMRIGLIVFAGLLALFTTGLLRVLPTHRRAIRLELFGASAMMALAGIFQDWGPDPGGERNLEGYLHTIAATAMIGLFWAAIITIAIAARASSKSSAWSAMLWPSICSSALLTIISLVFVFGPDRLEGLVQRGIFLTALTWLVTLTDVSLQVNHANTERSRAESNATPPVPGERPALPNATG